MALRRAVQLLLLLAPGAVASKLDDDLRNLQENAAEEKEWNEKPIAKVVKMLKDMQAQLQLEADNDEELYDKLACWCETNDKEKTKAIADATQLIKELDATIKENAGLAHTREAEIEQLTKEAKDLTGALDEAEALRGKEYAEFNEQEKDLINSISALNGAVTSMGHTNSNPGGASFQQAALLQVSQRLRHHAKEALAAVAPHMRAKVRKLLLQPAGAVSLLQESQPVGQSDSYAPQSGEIFGMLKQMKETFETNFETGKKNEAQAVADYQSIKTTKESQLKAAKNKIYTKNQELAQAKETLANSDENKEDTEKQLAADEEFLAKLKQQCADIDAQWEERSKVRSEEIAAVGETIGILTSDESRDQFNDAGQFMQLRAESKLQARSRSATADFLADYGKTHHSPRISMLASKVRNDVFAKVTESIDGLGAVLDDEQHDEVTKKDGCVSDLNTNEAQTTEKNNHRDDVEAEINQLNGDIDAKNEEEAMLSAAIVDAQIQLKKASENRKQENQDFQQCVADQRATQAILEKAKQRMADFYAKKAALLQKKALGKRQTPPGGFKPLKKKKGGNSVMMLLSDIIAESKATEKEALFAEQKGQKDYEDNVMSTNEAIAAMQVRITNDEAIEAEEKEKEVFDQGDKRVTGGDILKLGEVGQTLHKSCDFTIDHFDDRQAKRAGEMEALKQAKAIFSGANFGL